jgi:hypothetical protein
MHGTFCEEKSEQTWHMLSRKFYRWTGHFFMNFFLDYKMEINLGDIWGGE